MRAIAHWAFVISAATLLTACTRAQQTLPDGTGGPLNSPNLTVPTHVSTPGKPHTGVYRDLDLLRRHGFADAEQASVSARVVDRAALTPGNLTAADFTLIVNGTQRVARVHPPGSTESTLAPIVLLVLPPNDPVVHSIAILNAIKYFAKQPAERLPWNVGIFDSNGKMTPFTNGRSQLLANLDVVDHTPEPFQYASSAGLPSGFQWDGSWMLKAEDAIGLMQRFNGPKVVLAINPLADHSFGLNDQMFAHNGPESLTAISQTIGAHIYIANVGGPEVYIPGGGAADDHAAQINTPGGPLLGTTPSYHQQVDPQMTAALNYYAYRTSMMMQTASDTLGGYANSLSDLAGKIHSDLDGNYTLDFDMTAEDTDKGIPSVEVRMANHDLRVAILDLVPIGSTAEAAGAALSLPVMEAIRKATRQPVFSPDYRIAQHVDYFPLHGGLEPVLPMSGSVEWTGKGTAPPQLFVVESVEDPNLSSTILQRAVQARWNGRSLSWERDGVLHPGNYLWRVTVHDGRGQVFASASEKVTIPFPRQTLMGVSSLVVGSTCREGEPATAGLQHRPAKPAGEQGLAHILIDPMHAADCRVKADAAAAFESADTLHAFVRIYPSEKLEKNRPESWTARFLLRSTQSGAVELEQNIPFTTDSGSGYLALVDLPLNTAGIHPGTHTLDVEMHGPGMRGSVKASRSLAIAAAP